MRFDMMSGDFEFEFRHEVDAPTEIFVPIFQYPDGYNVELSDGEFEINHDEQTLIVRHTNDRPTHTVRITRKTF